MLVTNVYLVFNYQLLLSLTKKHNLFFTFLYSNFFANVLSWSRLEDGEPKRKGQIERTQEPKMKQILQNLIFFGLGKRGTC